jgi:hypothetical protein
MQEKKKTVNGEFSFIKINSMVIPCHRFGFQMLEGLQQGKT